MRKFDYRTDWQAYTLPETNMISNKDDIIEHFTAVDIGKKQFRAAGIPLLKEGRDTVYVNDSDENTIIFGETGSKKTRSAILPLIAMCAGARESAFITDVKGELSANPKIQAHMKANGINGVYLDFRTFKGDGYNLFEHPFKLYREGKKDSANAMVMRFVSTLNNRFKHGGDDPYWASSAEQLMMPLIMLLFKACADKPSRHAMVNMLSLNGFLNPDSLATLSDLVDAGKLGDPDSDNMLIMLRTSLNNAEKTLRCILSFAQSMIYDFTILKDLMRMMSSSTFDVASMYDTPTFVFLIIPDETAAFDEISGMLIDIFYSELIEVYSNKFQGRKPPKCRINYICDEFCNLNINDMRAKISASRSRYMRWYLVCQSKKQLESVYDKDAGTIIGNCKNVLFLQSSDTDLLEYMSDLCGFSYITRTGEGQEPLVTRDMLKSLKKEHDYKEALFVRDEIRYFAKLPDIDTYEFLNEYETEDVFEFTKKFDNKIKVFTISMFEDGIPTDDDEEDDVEFEIADFALSDDEKKTMDELFDDAINSIGGEEDDEEYYDEDEDDDYDDEEDDDDNDDF